MFLGFYQGIPGVGVGPNAPPPAGPPAGRPAGDGVQNFARAKAPLGAGLKTLPERKPRRGRGLKIFAGTKDPPRAGPTPLPGPRPLRGRGRPRTPEAPAKLEIP